MRRREGKGRGSTASRRQRKGRGSFGDKKDREHRGREESEEETEEELEEKRSWGPEGTQKRTELTSRVNMEKGKVKKYIV